MKLEDLTDIMIAQIPGRLYSEMKKITTILADELSDITKKRFGVEVMGYEVSSYFVPVMALILDNRLGLMGFAGSCLMRAFCYKAIKSKYGNDNNGFDSGDFQDPLDPSPNPSLKQAPPLEDRVTPYYWESVSKNRHGTLN